MIALLREGCTLHEKAAVVAAVEQAGLRVHLGNFDGREMIGVVGGSPSSLGTALSDLVGVQEVREAPVPYALVSRDYTPESSIVRVADVRIGGEEVVVSAGPCAVESEEQIVETARIVAARGARVSL